MPGSKTTENDTDKEDVSEHTIPTNTPAHGNQGQGGNLFTQKTVLF